MKAEGRSPFVRLHELLADIKPGKPAINLSVGEPQHPIPPFVGPVLQAHLNDFGRYPANKGTDGFRKAAAAWLGRRYQLDRPLDPETEVIVLNGTREGLFLGAIAAKRYVAQRAGTPAILIPNPFYAAYSAGAAAAECEPVYLPTHARDRLPARPRRDRRGAARAHRRVLSSPRRRTRRARSPTRPISTRLVALARQLRLPDLRRRMLLRDLSQRPAAARHAASRPAPDFTNVVVFHSLSKRSNLPGLRVGFAAGDRRFLDALPRAAQHRGAAGAGAGAGGRRSPPMPTRPMSRRTASSMSPSSTSPTRSSAIATATSVRPAASSSGSTSAATAATRRWRGSFGATAACASFPATISHATAPTAAIPAQGYIRVALVQDKEITAEALHRLVAVLG